MADVGPCDGARERAPAAGGGRGGGRGGRGGGAGGVRGRSRRAGAARVRAARIHIQSVSHVICQLTYQFYSRTRQQ